MKESSGYVRKMSEARFISRQYGKQKTVAEGNEEVYNQEGETEFQKIGQVEKIHQEGKQTRLCNPTLHGTKGRKKDL